MYIREIEWERDREKSTYIEWGGKRERERKREKEREREQKSSERKKEKK